MLSINSLSSEHVLVSYDMYCPSGSAQLSRADLKDPDAVPPEAIASMGRIKYIDPKLLDELRRLRTSVYDKLGDRGLRFMGGWVISNAMLPEVTDILERACREYNDTADLFCESYAEQVKAWAEANPEWSSAILRNTPDEMTMRRRCRFDWRAVRIVPDKGSEDMMEEQLGFADEEGLDSIVDSIAQVKLRKDKRGIPCVGSRNISGIMRIIQRCVSLSGLVSWAKEAATLLAMLINEFYKDDMSDEDQKLFAAYLKYLGDKTCLIAAGTALRQAESAGQTFSLRNISQGDLPGVTMPEPPAEVTVAPTPEPEPESPEDYELIDTPESEPESLPVMPVASAPEPPAMPEDVDDIPDSFDEMF